MPSTFDVIVVGGGIIGLALADAWLARNPQSSIAVLEKEPAVAQHASGRNSGVLHAGFYYAPDTLKARLTRRGNQMLREFCAEAGVPVRATGKVVVAQGPNDLDALHELYRRGIANGVALELVDQSSLAQLEPLARTHREALWSPDTAVAAPMAVAESLAARVTQRGGVIRTQALVTAAAPGWVQLATDERLTCHHMINAAGLYADRVAHWFGVGREYRMLPFKGLYWYGNWPPGHLTRHVYPVPDPRNPFLGVHLTVTVDGRAKVGPTAIPALWRENYGGLSGFRFKEVAQVVGTFPRFLSSPHHDVPGLVKSELPKYVHSHLVRQAQRLVPSVQAADFVTRGSPGVRAQLFHVPSRKLEMDFVVRRGEQSTHVLNAVSPGWTSALAVAEYVIENFDTRQ